MKIPLYKRTRGRLIVQPPPSERLFIPLDGLEPRVRAGDTVRAGQEVAARADGAVRHSAWSGKVRSVGARIEIEGGPAEPLPLGPADIVATARAAGLVGMGGAAFPTFRKLELTRAARMVLINACESEPYVTCDSAVLAEQRVDVDCGMRLAMRAVGAAEGRIVADEEEVGYPGGYEGLLAERALGVEIPAGKRPADFGALVINVQTALALCQAVCLRRPLLDRVVTVDGDHVARPGNYRVAIGTPISHLLAAAGVDLVRAPVILLGGPMMGREADPAEPVGPGGIAVLALDARQAAPREPEPCMRCGRCFDVCPYDLTAALLIERPDASVLRCVECGACEFACPAHLPLVQLLRQEKERCRGTGRRAV